MAHKGYRFAVQWIAHNDSNGTDDGVEEIAEHISTCLVADLYEKTPEQVAQDVLAARQRKCENCRYWRQVQPGRGWCYEINDYTQSFEWCAECRPVSTGKKSHKEVANG